MQFPIPSPSTFLRHCICERMSCCVIALLTRDIQQKKDSAVDLTVRKNYGHTEEAVGASIYVTPYVDLHPVFVSSIGMVCDGGGLGGWTRAVKYTHAYNDSSVFVEVDEYVTCKLWEYLRAEEVDP